MKLDRLYYKKDSEDCAHIEKTTRGYTVIFWNGEQRSHERFNSWNRAQIRVSNFLKEA